MTAGLSIDLTARRGAFTTTAAFEVAPGETLALVGPNGAGKSTLLAAIAGLIGVVDGRISTAGRVLTDTRRGIDLPAASRRVGVVFQDYLLFDHLDVRDNVAFAGRMRGRSWTDARAAVAPLLDRFALEDLAERLPGTLSGGQAQRVALARALAVDPEVLLLDEPMAALDVEVRADVRVDLTRHLGGFGGATVLVTHSTADVAALADAVVVLENGRVTQTGTLDELRAAPATAYVERLLRAG
ncbi:hypothetical protein GCM10022200_09910 [Microbacterium awajiense]|uniref:ABC transporter domain-containing protein n=1 Tax=Microbacterium awajiense TaxID=415214 RepID=A0ABP7ACK6_9MICO